MFDPFPFPDAVRPAQSQHPRSRRRTRLAAQSGQAEHPGLTLTQIYNVLAKLRAGEALNEADEAIKNQGPRCSSSRNCMTASTPLSPKPMAGPNRPPTKTFCPPRHTECRSRDRRKARPSFVGFARTINARAPASSTARRRRRGRGANHGHRSSPRGQGAKAALPAQRPGAHRRRLRCSCKPKQAPLWTPRASPARFFRQGAKVEPTIARVLASLARLGHAHTIDGETFALRRRA